MVRIKYSVQILFVAVFGAIIFFALKDDVKTTLGVKETEARTVDNVLKGLYAVCAILIAESLLGPYHAVYFRKAPYIWRALAALCVIYLCVLVFFVFQTPDQGRKLLKYLDPVLGTPLTKDFHTYDDNCALFDKEGHFEYGSIIDNMDHYFLIHIINWFLAAMIFRDYYMLHFWSVLDEILELSWQHILPHFRECWWDHIFLDVLVTNTPGIFLGMTFIKICGFKEYDWLGRKGKKSIRDWDVFNCHRRFGSICYGFFVICVNFICGFFLMDTLWFPPKHFITLTRLAVWFCLGNLAFREGYEDVNTWNTLERKDNPIEARYRWLTFGVCLLETLLSWKYRHGASNIIHDAGWPSYIAIPWLTLFAAIFVFYLYLRFKKGHTTKTITQTEAKKRKQAALKEKNLNNQSSKKILDGSNDQNTNEGGDGWQKVTDDKNAKQKSKQNLVAEETTKGNVAKPDEKKAPPAKKPTPKKKAKAGSFRPGIAMNG